MALKQWKHYSFFLPFTINETGVQARTRKKEMGSSALILRRHCCFSTFLALIFHSLKNAKRFVNGCPPSSHHKSTREQNKSEGATEVQQKEEEESEDDLFEISLEVVTRGTDDQYFLNPTMATVHFAGNDRVLLANCLSSVLELSAAIPVTDGRAPPTMALLPEIMAGWIRQEDCDKPKNSSFRKMTSNIKRLVFFNHGKRLLRRPAA